MWFKNLYLFRLTETFEYTPESLEAALATLPFRPCGSQEPMSLGWSAPLGRKGQALVHAAAGNMMICLQREERLLPAAVVREELEDKIAEIEDSEGRRVSTREKRDLRDEIEQRLMPRAFTRRNRTFAYIDPSNGWLVVDAASAKRAEELASHLRRTLGSLPIVPPRVNEAPAAVMTQWLREGQLPGGFELASDCELRDPQQEGAVVQLKRHELEGDEVRVHLDAGKQATRLALDWQDQLGFVLGEDLIVKRLKFLDMLQEQVEEAGPETAAEQFDVEFVLMTETLARLLPDLMGAFGGEAETP